MKSQHTKSIDCDYDLFVNPRAYADGQPTLHPRPIGRQKLATKDIVKEMYSGDSARQGEVNAIIANFLDKVTERLCGGDSIHIPGLGTLRITLKGPKGVTSANAIRSEHIKLGGISLNPDRKLMREMDNAIHFVRSQADNHSAKLDMMPLIDIMADFFSTTRYNSLTSKDLMSAYRVKRAKAQQLIDMAVQDGLLLNMSHQPKSPLYCPTEELLDYMKE